MFKSIANLWRGARGTALFKQVDEIARTMPSLQGQAGARCIATILSEMPALRERTGNFTNVSNDGRKQIAKSLAAEARKSFDFDDGRGTALTLMAIYVETSALPGADAARAHSIAGEMIAGIEHVYADSNESPTDVK